ncbi:MAG TPA: ATP-binding cassette domain-containing protein, partial [Rectinemataceae bacterium]|nr:ATP-binding cassette domain-containing protein [Rectinemataceae bacterium]
MALIEIKDALFCYEGGERPAVEGLCLSVEAGDYLAIVGPNGSGKSTLLRLLNGLLAPQSGSVLVDGLDASDPRNARAVRSALTLVFQSPPDQIVSTVVEEDVAFGPENLGLARAEIGRRVSRALEATGLTDERCSPPHFLSAGQQQRLAVAGAIAMEPKAIAFDEATSMLDPAGRDSILSLIDGLVAKGITVIHVTHDMSEAARARRIVAMVSGRVAFDGSPSELWGGEGGPGQGELPIASLGLPASVAAGRRLGVRVGAADSPALIASLVAAEREAGRAVAHAGTVTREQVTGHARRLPATGGEAAFALSGVSYSYLRGTSNE